MAEPFTPAPPTPPKIRLAAAIKRRAAKIKLAFFDVDGTLTDGTLFYGPDGGETKAFSVKDGAGLALLRQGGIKLAIITARKSAAVEHRARDLGVHYTLQGVKDKLQAYEELLAELQLPHEAASYMGDDWVDLPPMRRAGLAVAVPDAAPAVLQAAHYVTQAAAGHGAARELADMILMAQELDEALLAPFLA
jgi:3-deoxy-D-manno-octulosonate 8-phosphate phosphatase (KDO 8-P phosphatase)